MRQTSEIWTEEKCHILSKMHDFTDGASKLMLKNLNAQFYSFMQKTKKMNG